MAEQPVTINYFGMKQSWFWLLLPLAVLLAVFGFFFALFPDRFLDGGVLFWPVALLALAAGVASYTPVRGFQQGWNLVSIIVAAISVLTLIASAFGVALELNGLHTGSMVAGLITIIGFAVIPFASGMEYIPSRSVKKSSAAPAGGPTIWADRLEAIGRSCSRPEVKTRVLRLGGETRFLTSGEGAADSLINQGISRAIEQLAESIRNGDESSALSMLGNIRSLFAQRENQLKP